jgi:hypothetical protein
LNFGTIAAGACDTQPVTISGADLSDDAILVTPGIGVSGSDFDIHAAIQSATVFGLTVCNHTALAADPDGASGAPYNYVAIQD